ncbi:lysozyme protein [Rhizobium leguminosarum bv. phaseoli CCGM1]|uniref:lysozyme n=1 Tax=Rhizobium phaseoli TaxID=396 RepID=UPI0004D3EB89|nr:lysozyme [Rhizobium phaseoli]KEC75483.1 lysozyme protein [Rhizobium leguminosarum bv. phaseoli CCGM1]PWI54490.1 lysozyme [Rhizobium phaseoli]
MTGRMKKGSAVAAAAVALVGGFEGLRQHAYPDPATGGQPWTLCYGSTNGVKPGDYKTVSQCKALLALELQKYAEGIEQCVTVPLPDSRFVALTSFAYNVGVKGACGSSAIKLINQGKTAEGCEALLKWNRAAGIVFPGLTRRRQKERQFCLEGI